MQDVSLLDDIDRAGLRRQEVVEEKDNRLGQEDFMTLMIAQFRNQDPFKPLDNGQFLGQLAQFGTVDGISRLNSSFTELTDTLFTDQALQAASLVGRTVLAAKDNAFLPTDGEVNGAVELEFSAENVQVDITDASGQLIRRLEMGLQPPGTVEFRWDGLTDEGERAPEGNYTISARSIRGRNTEGLETLIRADIESVNLGRAGVGLTLNLEGGEVLSMNQVRRII